MGKKKAVIDFTPEAITRRLDALEKAVISLARTEGQHAVVAALETK